MDCPPSSHSRQLPTLTDLPQRPCPRLVFSRYDELGASYARAREQQQHLRADELLEIVDDKSNDWVDVETRRGRIVRQFDHEHVKRSV